MFSGSVTAERGERLGATPPRLDAERCRALLATGSSGHLALSQGALPLILPATCALVGGSLLVRVAPAMLGPGSLQPGVVAFEAGGANSDSTWRWEVLVRGRADVIPVAPAPDVPPSLALVASDSSVVLRVSMELITGWEFGALSSPYRRQVRQRR